MSGTAEDYWGLEQVYELNRIFLHFLHEQVRHQRPCLGLPREAIPLLRRIQPADLERLAEFPRALFDLRIGSPGAGDGPLSIDAAQERARQAVHLTILVSVWNLCRRRGYRARAFLGLTVDSIRRLRATALAELVALAQNPRLIACAFDDSPWLWRELLTATDDAARQRLLLVALQPQPASLPEAGGRNRLA